MTHAPARLLARLLGESFGTASRSIQSLIDDGSMVVSGDST